MPNTDDFVRDVLASVSPEYKKLNYGNGVKPKRKKKTMKKVSGGTDELAILESDMPDYISYGQIKKGKEFKRSDNIEDWIARDFVYLLRDLHDAVFERKWNLNFGGVALEVTRIHDAIALQNGFCNNIVLRDYINFYFKYYAQKTADADKEFYTNQLRNEKYIKHFIGKYNFKSSFDKEIDSRTQRNSTPNLNEKLVKDSIMISDENFLYEYGFVVFINWFIFSGLEKVEIIKKAIGLCRKLHKEDKFNIVLEATSAWGSYPKWFKFSNVSKFLSCVNKDLNLEIEFITNSETDRKFSIMRKKDG
tara:strand:+ start:30748 stop:31662 length:915 start_codon:yes stop_codon:yes gene_type:complete